MPSLDRALPNKFSFISNLTSVELKLKLKEMIFSLYDLLEDYEAFDPNLTARELIERFFAYLIDSCKDQDTLQRRAEWALKYGEIVEDRLLLMRSRRINVSPGSTEPNDPDLMVRLNELTNAIAHQRIVNEVSVETDDEVIKTLEIINLLCIQIVPDKMNASYQRLICLFDGAITAINQRVIPTGNVPLSNDELIIVTLLELRYEIARYLIRNGSHRK